MRWMIRQEPTDGETRSRKKFAWLPTRIGKYTVWLEFYFVQERYCRIPGCKGWWAYENSSVADYYV